MTTTTSIIDTSCHPDVVISDEKWFDAVNMACAQA